MATGVLEEEAGVLRRTRQKRAWSVGTQAPGSLLRLSNTAQSFLAENQNELALILSEWKLRTFKIVANFALWHTALS